MGFGDFLRGVSAQINPFDNGKTYATYNPKKKKPEENPINARPAPVQKAEYDVENPVIRTKQPQNPFGTLNNSKQPLSQTPQNTVPVVKDYSSIPAPTPGTIVKPQQSRFNMLRDIFDANTEADKYRRTMAQYQKDTKQFIDSGVEPKQAADIASKIAEKNINNVDTNTFQNRKAEEARAVGTVASNFGGGLLGVLKGAVGIPSFALRLPQTIRYGSAWLTGNDRAKFNTANDNGTLIQLANSYDNLVKPVTNPLTSAELATDRFAQQLSPSAPEFTKDITKGLANILPVEAAVAAVAGIAKARKVTGLAKDAAEEAAGTTAASPNITNIPVRKDIPVSAIDDMPEPIAVRDASQPADLIQEVGGDAAQSTTNSTLLANAEKNKADQAAAGFEADKKAASPDQRIEGVFPIQQGDTAYVTNAEINAERAALDDALANKEITKAQHKAANKELDNITPVDGNVDGKKIEVKTVNPVDVIDKTDVPVNADGAPGTVRVTTKTDQQAAKTQLAAQQPALPPLPKVGSVLPDGTIVTKRMVQSARTQRKNAKALLKAQEQTSEAMSQINAKNGINNAADSRQPGLILSDETKKGKKGVYQVAKQSEQTNELGTKSVDQIIQEADNSVATTGTMTDRDVANVKAALDSGTYRAGTPEYKKLSDLYWKDAGTHDAQRFALRNQTNRRTASAKELYNKAVSKIVAFADDPSKLTDDMIKSIEDATNTFADIRDAAKKAADDFNATPSKENYDKFVELSDQLNKAEKALAMSEFSAAKKALKGNVDIKAKRMLQDAADQADMYTMDFVDASLLSSTGTFVRNFINATLGSLEEGLFGGAGARVGTKLTNAQVGGGVGRGFGTGAKKGASNIYGAAKSRFKEAGWNPIEHMKNWSTTGNQLGDIMIEGSIGRSIRNQYEKILKKQGYTGEELRMRADVMAMQDPENLARDIYAPQARKDAGLGSGVSKQASIEKAIYRTIADNATNVFGDGSANIVENVSKGIVRLFVGFPSAVGRSMIAGSQRIVPFVNVDTAKMFTAKTPELRAAAIKESIKKSGSAATVGTIFYTLGANGAVTGSYPKDQNERDRWEREGIKENSIKIGDAWYDIPSYMGSFGLPALVYASLGRNNGLNENSLKDISAMVGSIAPTDGITKINDVLSGRSDISKYTQNIATSSARMATPYGSLLNQISKVFDPTQNDTSGDNWLEGTINKIIDGVPGVDRVLPDKKDKEGNTLYNPSVVQTMAGASGAVQQGGEQRTSDINAQTNGQIKALKEYGALDDANLKSLLEGQDLGSYKKALANEQLDESDIKELEKAFVKGVDVGTDTAYLEREQYDTNLTVLKIKRDMMKNDQTVAPSKLKDIETDIKRGEIYKKNKTPYQDIADYKSVGLEDWRDMGDPESDTYNIDMYNKLYQLDQLMTADGVSYKRGDSTKPKYYLKNSSGSGSGGSKRISTDFGSLKAGAFSPKVQEYATIGQQSGSVPIIKTVRPNIVHKITTSR